MDGENNGKPYWTGWFGGTTIFGNIHNFPDYQSCIWYLSSYREHLSSHLIWKQLCLIQHQRIHPTFWGLGCAAWRMWHTWAVQFWTQTTWWDEMKQNSTLSLYITIYIYIYICTRIYIYIYVIIQSWNLKTSDEIVIYLKISPHNDRSTSCSKIPTATVSLGQLDHLHGLQFL